MPRKIRELKQELRREGCREVPGKGSHVNFEHYLYAGKITIAGKDGADAKPYQEKEVRQAIEQIRRRRLEEDESK